ncbi:hypothetical protein ASPCAL00077 [Aspergillus calidoustus]|uniref:Zn(2)-C6 fungal-type domain-containing protein n=1 Tax=Aspergillus calidoustus TaxID=454130 RepID=A0A0U5FPF4_ASPCI|nr:hypothetical protein ASPCAL00077 [Aspergillus calidoustus]
MADHECRNAAHQAKKAGLACEKCRVLKVKCIRVEGQPCTKCSRSNSECIVPEPKQQVRPRRAKPRLADLESKLTDILGLLSGSNTSSSGDQSFNVPDVDPPGIDIHVGSDLADWLRYENPTVSETIQPPLPAEEALNTEHGTLTLSEALGNSDSAWITDLGLSPAVLPHLLDNFRRMSAYFPFVRLPEDLTAESMVNDRPFLLLAAVTNGSSRYRHLQGALIEKFKEALSQSLILAGEKDLDLLQGLLLHLAWFHFHFNPWSPQTYRYLQIAISMVVDLGLDKMVSDMMDGSTECGDAYSRDASRAYLGCYYISSVISTSNGKPNNLSLSDKMLQATRILQQTREFETDNLIYPLIQLQHLVERICETYRFEKGQPSRSRLPTHAGIFARELGEWWSAVPADLRENALLLSGYHATKVRIYDMGLAYNYGDARGAPGTLQNSATLPLCPMLINNLVQCVEYTKEYLDLFFAIPENEYTGLSFCIWYKTIIAIFILYRLSTGVSEIPEWDVNLTHQTLDVEGYLGRISSHLECLQKDVQAPNKTLFSMIPEIIGSVRRSYEMARGGYRQALDARHPHQSFSPPASSARGRYRCPGMRNLKPPTRVTVTEDSTLQSAVSAEIQMIENELLWTELLVTDAFSTTTSANSTTH